MTSISEFEQAEANPQPEPKRRNHKRTLEFVSMGIMALGAAMMFQPFLLVLFTYSFIVFLFGTLMFIVVSHFADE